MFSAHQAFRPSLSLTVPARFGLSPNFLVLTSCVRHQVILAYDYYCFILQHDFSFRQGCICVEFRANTRKEREDGAAAPSSRSFSRDRSGPLRIYRLSAKFHAANSIFIAPTPPSITMEVSPSPYTTSSDIFVPSRVASPTPLSNVIQ